jgi:mannose-6-phosphate isomerase-like protein (cupin superfamily)
MQPLPFLLLAVGSLFAADPQGLAVWRAQELKQYEKTLAPKVNELKQAAEQLGDYGNHTAWVAHRGADGEMEIHENWADLMFIQTGEAELLVGGTIVNPRTTAAGEIRGTTSTGGKKITMKAGDVIQVPAGMPHQFLVAKGKQITFFTMKIAK